MASPYYSYNVVYDERWRALNLLRVKGSVVAKLTDGDVRGLLVCIDAKNKLEKLVLAPCDTLLGDGLSPLSGSTVLEHLNLSMVEVYESPVIEPKPALHLVVVPILNSILETEGNSLKYIRFPKVWKERKSEVLSHFFEKFNQAINAREVGCSKCNGICVGTSRNPWVPKEGEEYGVQQFTCHGCLDNFCSECTVSNSVEFCPCCEVKYCNMCSGGVQTCSVCNTTGCNDGCNEFFSCDLCENTHCRMCNNMDFCESCDQLLCENCSPLLKCQGHDTCHKMSCIDCLKEDRSVLKQCTSCGNGFCSTGESPECNFMEYCHRLEGDICSDCHTKEHDVTECYWKSLPTELREILPESTGELSFDKLVQFWHKCTQLKFFVPDRDFDLHVYGQIMQASVASIKLAIEYLLQNQDSKAVYLLFFCGLMKEIEHRGPDDTVQALEDGRQAGAKLCKECGWFRGMVHFTTSREHMIAFIQSEIGLKKWTSEGHFVCDEKLSKVDTSTHKLLHDLKASRDRAFGDELKGVSNRGVQMLLTVSNVDTTTIFDRLLEPGSSRSIDFIICEDATLTWFLRTYVFKMNYYPHVRCPKITPLTKYFRVLHKGKTLFLSSAGKKTLFELGLRHGDDITIGGIETESTPAYKPKAEAKAKAKPSKSKKAKKSKGPKEKTKKDKQPKVKIDQLLTEEKIMEKHRQAHSKLLTPVLEELGPLLKEIRNKLHNLNLCKSAPKVRKQRSKKKEKLGASPSSAFPTEETLGGKAGKVAYPILVGEAQSLYKTKKSSRKTQPTITLDLHGLTKDAAIEKLNDSLQAWVDIAMKGEDPWVIPVDIICGGGNQTLSEATKGWIQGNRQVANRPKKY